jgi:hypothetical protein
LQGRSNQRASAASSDTATQFYVRYRATVAKATNVEDIISLWTSDQVQGYKSAPPNERVGLEEIKKTYATYLNVTVVKEAGTPNYVTLVLEGLSPEKTNASGTVQVIRENGAWRVAGLEEWK